MLVLATPYQELVLKDSRSLRWLDGAMAGRSTTAGDAKMRVHGLRWNHSLAEGRGLPSHQHKEARPCGEGEPQRDNRESLRQPVRVRVRSNHLPASLMRSNNCCGCARDAAPVGHDRTQDGPPDSPLHRSHLTALLGPSISIPRPGPGPVPNSSHRRKFGFLAVG